MNELDIIYQNFEYLTHIKFSYVYFLKMSVLNSRVQVVLTLNISPKYILKYFRNNKKRG